ncbi:MAG TPA: hypothetical protein VMG80_02265, partial [Solirubrobacteraceae bacterium]|nr:hypothetical protein [Solirubrobacteraceae bacterium]
AVCHDGASRALAGTSQSSPTAEAPDLKATADAALTDALASAAGPRARVGPVLSVDLFYDDIPETSAPRARGTAARGRVAAERGRVAAETGPAMLVGESALAVEMEAATLFAVGARAGIPVACVLAVSDVFDDAGARTRIDDESLLSAAEAMGAAAVAALR